MEFAAAWPCFMKDGVPLSWRHFVYGLNHLSRAHARESLRMASMLGAAFGSKETSTRYFNIQESHAGWK